MNLSVIATVAAVAALISSPATAYADCGDPDQPPCTGPVPTVDQVLAAVAELTDPGANKNDVVTPGFSPEETQTINDHLNQMNARGLLPLTWVVTDIQPAPNNFAGATITSAGTYYQRSAPGPIVLANQGGRWLLAHDTAKTAMDNTWYNANRPKPLSGNSI